MIPDDYKFHSPGSTLNFADKVPQNKKILPFPLENIEEDLADIYFKLDLVRKRIEVVKRNNVTSKTSTRYTKIKKMQYKISTAMSFVKRLVKDLDTFWVN
jgi:hypothetical protein